MHQPSRGSVNYLAQAAPGHMITRVDFALDLVVDHAYGARRLCVFLMKHLRQLWHGKRRANSVFETVYYGRAWHRRNIALYPTRVSKVTGTDCAHVEFRFYSAAVCKRMGLVRLTDITSLDVIDLLQRNCRLSAIVPKSIEARLQEVVGCTVLAWNRRKHSKPVTRPDVRLKVRQLLARTLNVRPARIMSAAVQCWYETWHPFREDTLVDAPLYVLINKHQCPFLF